MRRNHRTDPFGTDSRFQTPLEAAVGVIVVLSLIPLVAQTAVTDGGRAWVWLERIDMVFWALFLIEYLLRLGTAENRLRYSLSFYGVIDLLAVLGGIPGLTVLTTMKVLRVLRVLRVLKLARYSSAVERFSAAFNDIKDELALYTGVTAVIAFIASYGIWQFEHEANEAYSNLFEAVYWSVASLTMGAEGIAPTTVAGKILAMLLVLLGLGIVAVPSGLLASALSKTDSDDSA